MREIKVVARRRDGYTHDVEMEGGHMLVMDEPASEGGADLGASPTRVVGAALAACTAITCEMYAERKGWELGDVEVDVNIQYDETRHGATGFEVTLRITEELDAEQQERLRAIAGKCPVHRVITGQTPIEIVDRIERQAPSG